MSVICPVERRENGRCVYRLTFADDDIELVKFTGTLYSVKSLASGEYEAPLPCVGDTKL